MKKNLVRLFFLFVILLVSVEVQAYRFSVNGVYYVVQGINNVYVTYGLEEQSNTNNIKPTYKGAYTIPSTVRDSYGRTYTVVGVEEYAFYNCTGVTSISLPSTVTTIKDYAFYGCTSLRTLTAPSATDPRYVSGLSISKTALSKPFYLNNMLVLAVDYNDIGTTNMFKIDDGTVAICSNAFNYATNRKISEVSYPSTIRYIGYQAFNASSIKSVTKYHSDQNVPENVVCGVSDKLFMDPSSYGSRTEIEHFDFPDGNEDFKIDYSRIGINELHLPASIKKISCRDGFDRGANKLIIDDIAAWCNIDILNYTEVPLGYGGKLYLGDEEVTHLVIPEGVNEIKTACFVNSGSVASLSLPESLEIIGESAFECCNFKEIRCPNNLKEIKKWAFNNCFSLETLYISASVNKIDEYAIGINYALAKIIVNKDNPIYDSRDNCDALIETSTNTLIFGGASSLIPPTVTKIGESAFNYRKGLRLIAIPNSVVEIGESAFYGCSDLESVIIPSSVSYIGSSVFYNCNKLTEVINYAANPQIISSNTFYGVSKATLHVRNGYKEAYANADYWKDFAIVEDAVESLASGKCGENVNYTLSVDGKLIISGTGAMYDYPDGGTPWDGNKEQITNIEIEDGVTSIGERAFKGCCSLSEITMHDGIETIGDSAFDGCSSLTSIVLPENLMSLGDIFVRCSNLKSITLNNKLENIHPWVFRYCPNLERIDVADGSEQFRSVDGVLYNYDCTTLVRCPINKEGDIEILPSTKVIWKNAFEACKFTSITLPESVNTISHSAFIYCASLESINIPEGVEIIDVNAFHDCNSLKSLVMPRSVKDVRHQALYCSLESVTCLAFIPPTLSESACNEYGTLHVRKGCGTAYANADVWKNFTIVEDAVENPNTVYAECVRLSTKSSEAKLPIYLNNEISMCGFEFFLQLPEGVSIVHDYDEEEEEYVWGIERGGRLRDKHGINVSRSQDGTYHFLCADLQTNSNFYDSDAKKDLPLLTLKLAFNDNVQIGDNDVIIRDILLNHNENSTITEYTVNEEKSLMTIVNAYKLSADCNNDEFGQVTISATTYSEVYGDANAGDNVTITAVPAEHYRFVKWTENGEELSTANPYSFTLNEDRNITAVFEKNQFTVTFLDFDETVISQGLQEYNTELTVPEDPTRDGYFFYGWTPALDEFVPEHDVTYTAQYVMIGDVTGDNKRNLTDLTTLVNYIMNNVTPDSRAFLAADVNKDKKLNLTDMTSIVNLIIGGETSMAKGTSAYYQSGNEAALSIHASELRAGSDGILSIALNDNEDKIANLQFDLSLPHGIALSSEDLTGTVTSTVRGMSNGHNIAVKRLDSGDIRVMLFSYTNSTFCDSNDDVININVTVGNTAMDGEYEVTLKNVVLVRNNATAIEHDECNYAINVGTITGIDTLSETNNAEDSIFDVSGKKQENVRRGVNIINGRKIVSTK